MRRPPGAVGAALAIGIASFALILSWTFVTPIGGSPDEPGHIAKASAAVRGELVGQDTAEPGIEIFNLPADIVVDNSMLCYVFDKSRSADCGATLDGRGDGLVPAVSGVGSYNPVYYLLVGWPSLLLDGDVLIYAMRVLSATLNAFFIGVAVWALVRRARGIGFALSGLALALTPTAYFLMGSVNPNGLEVTSVAAFAALAFTIADRPDLASSRIHVAMLGLSAVIAANLRATTPLFLVIVAVLAVIVMGPTAARAALITRRALVLLVPAVVACAFGPAWTLLVSSDAGFIPVGDERDGFFAAILGGFARSDGYLAGMVGVFGWLDTSPSLLYFVLWAAGAAVLVLVPLARARGRLQVALVLASAAFLAGPALVQAVGVSQYGYIWQGRYSLGFWVILAVLAAVVSGAVGEPRRSADERFAVGIAWAVSGTLLVSGIALTARRFTTGLSASYDVFFAMDGWQPPIPWPVLIGIELVAVLVAAVVAMRLVQRPEPGSTPSPVDSDSGKTQRA